MARISSRSIAGVAESPAYLAASARLQLAMVSGSVAGSIATGTRRPPTWTAAASTGQRLPVPAGAGPAIGAQEDPAVGDDDPDHGAVNGRAGGGAGLDLHLPRRIERREEVLREGLGHHPRG